MAQSRQPSKPAGLKQRNLILFGAIILAAAVIAVVFLFRDEGPTPQRTAQRPSAPEPAKAPAEARRPAARPRTVERRAPIAPAARKTPARPGRDAAVIQAYLTRYEKAVADNGDWQALSEWADKNGLYVEAYHCRKTAGAFVGNRRWATHDATLVVPTEDSERTGRRRRRGTAREMPTLDLVSQQTFEETLAVKPSLAGQPIREQVVAELRHLKPGGGSANQSRIASLLIKVDSPHGRKLYEQSIEEPGFDKFLVRALEQGYFSGLPMGEEWQASWYHSPPMNLWLIRQLVAYTPREAESAKNQAAGRKRPTGARRGPPMGPPGMLDRPGRGRRVDQQASPALAHKILMLRILARRGGLMAAHLMGELIANDQSAEIINGLASEAVPSALFTRFTGRYADPMVNVLGAALNTHGTNSDTWSVLAGLMARSLNRDAARQVVDSAASSKMPVDGDVGLYLAAGADREVLDRLLTLAGAGQLTGFDVPLLFSLWTQRTQKQTMTFWEWISSLLPGGADDELDTERSISPTQRPGPDMLSPVDPTMGPPGLPRVRGPRGRSAARVRRRSRSRKAAPSASGWPVKRTFRVSVDAVSAKEFLMGLGELVVPEAEAPKKPARRTRGRRPPSRSQRTGPKQGPADLKRDAVRALASLYDGELKDYYRRLIVDEAVGPIANLALCLINDSASTGELIEQFWKETAKPPFGLTAFGDVKDKITIDVYPGKVSVPRDALGLAQTGITTREALVYFDVAQAGEAFLAALNQLNRNQDPVDRPQVVAQGACQAIEAIGRWRVQGGPNVLADLIESTGDFGLRGTTRRVGSKDRTPHAMLIRRKALAVLGQIGDQDAVDVILRMAIYGEQEPELFLAARLALAKRGVTQALDLFLDILDPKQDRKPEPRHPTKRINVGQVLSQIDPTIKDMTDMALLAVGRTRMTDTHVGRAMALIRKLGQRRDTAKHKENLQERFVLKLIENNDARLLTQLANQIEQQPFSFGPQTTDPFYWNRYQGAKQDEAFLKMIRTLANLDRHDDEQAVLALAKAVMGREEANLVPDPNELSNWQIKKHLLEFRTARRSARPGLRTRGMGFGPPAAGLTGIVGGPVRRGPLPAPGPTRTVRTAPGRGRDRSRAAGPQLDLAVKSTERLSKVPQSAAEEALNLIYSLDNAKQFLRQFQDTWFYSGKFYRCQACLTLMRLGETDAQAKLVQYLTDPGTDPDAQYLSTLVLESLENRAEPALAAVFGRASAAATNEDWQLRLADATAMVIKRLWEDQMAGRGRGLADKAQMATVASAWTALAGAVNDLPELAGRLVIILAACPSDADTIDVMWALIKDQCGAGRPVPESAVGTAVDVMTGLNAAGSVELVELYKNILTLVLPVEKEDHTRRRTRTTGGVGAARRSLQTPAKNPAYVQIAPQIIQALAAMSLPESTRALEQLIRPRPDLTGYLTIAIYQKEPQQALKLMDKAISRMSSAQREQADAAKQIVSFLGTQPTADSAALIASAIATGAPGLTELGLTVFEKWIEAGVPADKINLKQNVKSIIGGLARRIGSPGSAEQYLKRAVDLARQFRGDRDVELMLDRLKKVQARQKALKERKGSKTKGTKKRTRRRKRN